MHRTAKNAWTKTEEILYWRRINLSTKQTCVRTQTLQSTSIENRDASQLRKQY